MRILGSASAGIPVSRSILFRWKMREAGTALSEVSCSCATTHPRTPNPGMKVHRFRPCNSSRGKRSWSGGAICSSCALSAARPVRSATRPRRERRTSCSSDASSDEPTGQIAPTPDAIRESLAAR
eukprot:scaffold237152_cov30-Tisochrysis_lutea.AAC.5